MKKRNRFAAAVMAAALCLTAAPAQLAASAPVTITASAESIADLPADFQYAADWIWQNRIEREQSTVRRNTIFDQIVAGKGTINYVVKWQSYQTVTYEQRQQFEQMLSDCINAWNDWLAGYENWPYDHIDVKVVGWAVIDKSCLLDLHDDEVVYTDTRYYDAQYDTTNGRDTIPDREPYAPSELSRFDHFAETGYEYPGGLDKRFDMYMWATQGFPDIGGCGGDWGQRLSDTAYLSMIDSSGIHVLEHEIGHGFGMTDFYGGEGESDGFPPGGFPGGENSIMMAGSAAKITNFDGWMLRYMWTKIKDDPGRFDLANAQPETSEPVTEEPTTEPQTEPTTEPVTEEPTEPVTELPTVPVTTVQTAEFTDTITKVELREDGGTVTFSQNGTFTFTGTDYYAGDDSRNLAYYESDDRVSIRFTYVPDTKTITSIESLTLVENAHITKGDVNADGVLDLLDLILMQKWLHAIPGTSLQNWQAGDLYKDEVLDVYDAGMMKKEILSDHA